MNYEAIKLNILNVFALSMSMMDIERWVVLLVGVTALIYNCLKIYKWIQNNSNS